MKTVQNEYGISIKVCCASCVFKALDSGGLRICTNGRGHVKRTDSCDGWMMKRGLENAGKGGGKVKKGDYLRFNHEQRQREMQLFLDGKTQVKAAARSRKATISGSTMNKDSVKCSSSLTGKSRIKSCQTTLN